MAEKLYKAGKPAGWFRWLELNRVGLWPFQLQIGHGDELGMGGFERIQVCFQANSAIPLFIYFGSSRNIIQIVVRLGPNRGGQDCGHQQRNAQASGQAHKQSPLMAVVVSSALTLPDYFRGFQRHQRPIAK